MPITLFITSGLLIIAIGILGYRFIKNQKQYENSDKNTDHLKKELQATKNQLLQEKQSVDLHREELLTQTEHLQELNEELERLSLVASKTDTAVLIADEKGRFIWGNDGFVKLFGYTFGEFIEVVGKDLFSVSSKLNIQSMVKNALSSHQSLNYTSKVITKSGETKWVKTTLNPIFNENNKISQYIILDTDVSELKMINDKLKKLSLVASKTSNAVLIFDGSGEIDWVNDGFHKMYGYTRQEFTDKFGITLADFCKTFEQPELFNQMIKEQQTVTFVNSFKDRFDVIKWKQTTITPVVNDQKSIVNFIVVESDISPIKEAEQKLQEEKNKSDQLLLNILPEETAEELKTKGKATPRFYRGVSVLFADIQDFTKLAENLTPDELVHALQSYFSRFDDAVERNFVEKIKTMGDAYMCVGGIPMKNQSHPFDAVLLGLELQRIMKELGFEREESGRRAWQLRIGIHTGPVVAGVVGKQKMTYDIWGDTVNIAKRIESACVPGMVNISSSTYDIVKDFFECENRGKVLAKHKGHIDMYFVHRIKPEFSVNSDGITPNKYFKEMLAKL